MRQGLVISRLEAARGGFALRDISLEIGAGEYFLLIGHSGCGKTTLLKCIAGLCPSQGGEIFLDGAPLHGLPPEKRGIGYVPQGGLLFPHMTVRGNVAFGLAYLRLTRAQVRERTEATAELTGVQGLLDRRPATLSGGEARRAALARCLALRPKLLLLDEPLSMLDPEARGELAETLGRVHSEAGAITIHVTHDYDEATTLAGRAGIMREGRIAGIGAPDKILPRVQA